MMMMMMMMMFDCTGHDDIWRITYMAHLNTCHMSHVVRQIHAKKPMSFLGSLPLVAQVGSPFSRVQLATGIRRFFSDAWMHGVHGFAR